MRRVASPLKCIVAMLALSFTAQLCHGLEKEISLVTKKAVGEMAVAGRLDIDLHAEFMVTRTFDKDTAVNWFNCGFSGGSKHAPVGGTFGDFGMHYPADQRDEKYPKAVTIAEIPAVKFDGGDIMRGDFPAEAATLGDENMALEVWVLDENPAEGEVILGWQSEDGKKTSAALTYPKGFKGSGKWQHIVVNCTKDNESWYVNGEKVSSGPRKMLIAPDQVMVLGGASSDKPSFDGALAAVRLHEEAMTEEEIAHNNKGGVMLGTEIHDWWRIDEPDKWYVKTSKHFRHCVDKKEMAEWNEGQRKGFEDRLPGMFELSEKLYHLYSERHAMRSSVVSSKPEFRGDGIKYSTGIQPSRGSWMGWDGRTGFGWACQGAGHINPHELVHGWQGQTGGTMQGNYWEAHANFPQTYAGIYQTIPVVTCSRVCMFFPANGRNYYHARLMFEHLAQTPEYGLPFISKMWYAGGTEKTKNEYPWTTFTKIDPDPSTPLAYEWMRMLQKCITWDFETFQEGHGNIYAEDARRGAAEMTRYARVLLQEIPYEKGWLRPPKEMTPQQLAYNICPVAVDGDSVTAELAGYVSKERGSDWRMTFVGVTADGKSIYGDIAKPGEKLTFKVGDAKEVYLIVAATPTNVMAINMTGDFRSLEQEKFPYKVILTGAAPLDVLAGEKPTSGGAPHSNGGGFVAASAKVDATAYVGPNAQVLGNSKVLDNARIEGYAVINNGTVKDNAVVSDHALVEGGATIEGNAKVRDWARVRSGATLKDFAKVLEHASQDRAACGGFAVVKGVAWSQGPVRGTAMIDGSYAKHNDVDKGKWFTWSWGKGKNAGEVDEEFGGLYMQMTFDNPHEWMARDDFAATWGYLVGDPKIVADPADKTKGALSLNGEDQFVELQKDIADMGDISIKARVKWQGQGMSKILEFANAEGDNVTLGIARGRVLFVIKKGDDSQLLVGPSVEKDVWTELMVVLSADTGLLFVDDKEVARNDKMTFNPDDIRATVCYLGRGAKGHFFKGRIDNLEIYSVPLRDEVPPSPNPAEMAMQPIFINPTTVVMQALPGIDPLGDVEYFFEETSGNPGGDDSGWIKTPVYEDGGLTAGKTYTYTVKTRDTCGNEGEPSEPASVKWEAAKAFKSTDGKTIVIEAENFTRAVPGTGGAAGIEWKLSPRKDGCAGEGMIAALPDRGVQFDYSLETPCPRVDYLVNFPEKGKYAVWMRSWGAHPGSDSIYYGLDMKVTDRGMCHTDNGKLKWVRNRDWVFDVQTPGVHTVSVWMREDGSAFDRLIITSDLGMAPPSGEGPAESPQASAE